MVKKVQHSVSLTLTKEQLLEQLREFDGELDAVLSKDPRGGVFVDIRMLNDECIHIFATQTVEFDD